jgi:hypothetical protein
MSAEFDMDSAVADLADSMGLGHEPEGEQADLPLETEGEKDTEGRERDETGKFTKKDTTGEPAKDLAAAPSKEGADLASAPAGPRAAPKSWAKEQHERWAKLDKDTQDYIEKREKDFLDGTEQYRGEAGFAKEMKELITPYRPMLAAMNVSEKQAIQYLLNAQYRLTSGTPEQRAAVYKQIGIDLGLAAAEAAKEGDTPPDPRLQQLQERLNGVESALTQRQQADLNAARADAKTRVDKFAEDPAHPYFDEVALDIKQFIEMGHSLDEAYDKAVHANPITREKEYQRRLAADTEANKEKVRKEGEAARRATTHNVRGAESSRKAPTETKGSMEDTMRETLAAVRGRAH